MSVEVILDLAQQVNPRTKKEDISELSGGFSSQGFKVDVGAEPFVLLVQRPGAVSQSNYGHAYVVMKLLQKYKVAHSPEALWLKNDQSALAIKFYPGAAADAFDFRAADIDTEQLSIEVIDTLLDAAVVPLAEYEALARQLSVEPLPVQTPQDSAAEYGTAWFEVVKQSCPDQAIIDWLEPRIERSVTEAAQLGDNPVTFGHGDPSNPNILLQEDGAFMLIDWDSARFQTTGPEFYVAYTTHLTDFMKSHRQAVIAHVAERIGMSVDAFADKVYAFRRVNEVFDVNWAAMMMAKVSTGAVEGSVNDFREIALERMRIYDASFGTI